MSFVQIYLIFNFLIFFISARRTDTWPPLAAIQKHWDVDNIGKVCLERSGVDVKEINEFEMAEDMNHLPNSQALKIWFRCIAETTERIETNSNKLLIAKAIDFFADITEEEKLLYINMSKGCSKRLRNIRDPLEFTYEMNVCMKENDNEHYYSIPIPLE